MRGHPVAVMATAPTLAVAFALRLHRGDGERTAQRDRCDCGNHFVRLSHDVFLLESWLTGGIERRLVVVVCVCQPARRTNRVSDSFPPNVELHRRVMNCMNPPRLAGRALAPKQNR
jgi:hypothetical protein